MKEKIRQWFYQMDESSPIYPFVFRLWLWKRWRRGIFKRTKASIRSYRETGYVANAVINYQYFDTLNLGYIDVPKNASTSIFKTLLSVLEPETDPGNMIHDYVRQSYGVNHDEITVPHFSFGFVRNPFERTVSTYKNMYKKPLSKWTTFRTYLFGIYARDKGFAYYVKKGPVHLPDWLTDEHCVSQYRFLCKEDGEVKVDFLGRFENLSSDWEIIRQKSNNQLPTLPHYNATKKDNWRDYYTIELAELVYKRYQNDIELFGYQEEYNNLLAYLKEKEKGPGKVC